MAQRSSRFFMVPAEAADLLGTLVGQDMTVVVERRDGDQVNPFDGTVTQLEESQRAYVAAPGASTAELPAVIGNPGKHGWALFWLPRQDDSVLYMAEFGIQTAWFDDEGPYDNPEGLRTFDRVIRKLRPRLQRPTWAWDVASGKALAYRDVGFTTGAVEEASRGVAWMQRGVANVRYGVEPPTRPAGD